MSTAQAHSGPQEPPKRRGRPPGTTMPPEQRKGRTLRLRVTASQEAAYRARGGDDWLRRLLNRGSR